MRSTHDGIRALITGGSSGIGLAAATLMVERGWRVASLDVAPPARALDNVVFVQADLRDRERVREAVDRAAAELGGLDVVVNNAGIGAVGAIEENSDEQWRDVFEVNVFAIARVMSAALPHLRTSPGAAVVNTCSIAATAGLPKRALYSASKGAVYALTLAMAADLVGEGIRVNCVNPGTVDTPWVSRLLAAAEDPQSERRALEARQPLGRLVDAREVAEAIVYLASPASSSVTGTALAVDGGMQGLRPKR
ncbi:MAG TPA: SDR family oxidoreductase [Candidatus Baltobacteraceae bacterium]|nr:SDR family oxidoreductase [Candidatus Baltobacteraceae bacterium]